MSFCLPQEKIDSFKKALIDGDINPDDLAEMTSKERHDFLADIVGKDDAGEVNALFESKLLLKNQQEGYIRWAEKVAGITPEARRDIISRIQKMHEVLDPEDEKAFLSDLAEKKLGTAVSFDEVKQISNMSSDLTGAKANWDGEKWTSDADRMDYGSKLVALQDYIKDLKLSNEPTALKELLADKITGIPKFISTLGGIAKGVKASFDDSFIGRQGFKAMFTDPVQWAKAAGLSFKLIAKQLGKGTTDSQVLDAVKAEIYSRPNAMKGLYEKAKLDIGTNEEAYPNSVVEKVPLLGRIFKASEVAFEGTAYRLRADIFDKYLDQAERGEADTSTPAALRSIGKVVNSLTGRGDLGKWELVGKQVNNLFFSPKFVKSNFDFLTAHLLDKAGDEKMSSFARKKAALNLAKVVAGTAVVLGIASAVDPKSVEWDPTSSDFGKIRFGDTRFDVTGGMGSIVTLAARLAEGKTKASTTGKVTDLTSNKFGSPTRLDVLEDWTTNRAAPIGSIMVDLARNEDSNFKKPTVLGELENFGNPFVASNIMEMAQDPKGANWLLGEIIDGLGFSESTYPTKRK